MQGIERLLTADDVCSLLQVKKSYLYALTSENRSPHFKVGGFLRFRQSQLEAWIAEQAVTDNSAFIAETEAPHGRA